MPISAISSPINAQIFSKDFHNPATATQEIDAQDAAAQKTREDELWSLFARIENLAITSPMKRMQLEQDLNQYDQANGGFAADLIASCFMSLFETLSDKERREKTQKFALALTFLPPVYATHLISLLFLEGFDYIAQFFLQTCIPAKTLPKACKTLLFSLKNRREASFLSYEAILKSVPQEQRLFFWEAIFTAHPIETIEFFLPLALQIEAGVWREWLWALAYISEKSAVDAPEKIYALIFSCYFKNEISMDNSLENQEIALNLFLREVLKHANIKTEFTSVILDCITHQNRTDLYVECRLVCDDWDLIPSTTRDEIDEQLNKKIKNLLVNIFKNKKSSIFQPQWYNRGDTSDLLRQDLVSLNFVTHSMRLDSRCKKIVEEYLKTKNFEKKDVDQQKKLLNTLIEKTIGLKRIESTLQKTVSDLLNTETHRELQKYFEKIWSDCMESDVGTSSKDR